jgi:PAS domain S-box-containing protein
MEFAACSVCRHAAPHGAPRFEAASLFPGSRQFAMSTPTPEMAGYSDAELFRLLVETVKDYAIFVIDVDRHILTWSPAAERMLGYSQQEIIGQTSDLFFTPEDRAAGMPGLEVEEAVRVGRASDDRWHVRKDGQRFWCNGTATPLRDADGKLMGFAKIMRDLTDAKLAEIALRDARAYAQSIVDTVREPLLVLDKEMRVVTASRSFYQAFRMTPAATEGQPFFDFQQGEWNVPGLRGRIDYALQDEGFDDFEAEFQLRELGHRILVLNGRKLFRESNHTEMILVAIEDVTALRYAEAERRDIEERYRRMVESVTSYAIFMLDPAGRVVSWDQGAERVKGWKAEEVLGKSYAMFHPPELVAAGKPEQELEIARNEGRYTAEEWRVRSDGSRYFARVALTPIRDEQGCLSGYTKVVEDISALQQAREQSEMFLQELMAERARLQAVLDQMPSGLAIAQAPSGRLVLHNSAAARLLGPSLRSAVENSRGECFGAVHTDGRPYAPHEYPMVRALEFGEAITQHEMLYRRDDGSLAQFSVNAAPVRDAQGRIVAAVSTFDDISERKRAEKAFQESEARFRKLADNIPAGFIYQIIREAQGDARFSYVSGSVEQLLGIRPEEITENPHALHDRVHEDDLLRVQEEEAASFQSNMPFASQFRIRTQRGEVRWLHCRSTPQSLATGGFVWDGIAVDITDRVRAEEALREADRLKDEFLATLAHELRNPLAPVRNGLELFKLAESDPELIAETRVMMERQVDHLVRLVDDLLDVARITRGKVELRREVIDLGDTVARAIETVRPLVESRRHRLTVLHSGVPIRIRGDQVRLAQVIANLLNNAAKYSEEEGEIQIVLERRENQAVIRVRDRGMGIPADILPKVFDLFTQSQRTLDRSQGGLGIGLTLVKNLVGMHEGTVEAHSAGPGEGSEFVVSLPIYNEPEPSPDRVGSLPRQAVKRQRILIVDDNKDSANTLAMLLRYQGHEVETAYDGVTAIERAQAAHPSLVLLDIGLPRIDGYEVARRLRAAPATRNSLLVAMTGYGQEEDRRRSREAGFDHHLVKPIDPQVLPQILADMER